MESTSGEVNLSGFYPAMGKQTGSNIKQEIH